MQLLTLLDVILGLFFIYLIFSLVTSAMNEALAAMLSSRAKWLNKGIRSLFGEEGKTDNNVKTFYSSPFISYLNEKSSFNQRGVSYLPARAFLKAMLSHSPGAQEKALPLRAGLDSLLQHFPPTSLGVSNAIAALPAGKLHDALRDHYDSVAGDVKKFSDALDGIVAGIKEPKVVEAAAEDIAGLMRRLKQELPANWNAMQAAIEKLPAGSPIQAVLKDMMLTAQGNVAVFEKSFETWYAAFETQVSSWYRQKTHLVLGVLGIVIAFVMNVDTLALVRQLSGDAKVREAVVQQAMARVAEGGVAAPLRIKRDELLKAFNAMPVPVSTDATAVTKHDDARKAYELAQQAYERGLKSEVESLDRAGLSIGWEPGWWGKVWEKDAASIFVLIAMKLAGILLTAAALTLGAPFWFDMLKRVAQIRSVGMSLSEKREAAEKKSN